MKLNNHWLNETPPWDEPQYMCHECDKPMMENKEHCSNNCWEASQL